MTDDPSGPQQAGQQQFRFVDVKAQQPGDLGTARTRMPDDALPDNGRSQAGDRRAQLKLPAFHLPAGE
jgi:hypothetical protein